MRPEFAFWLLQKEQIDDLNLLIFLHSQQMPKPGKWQWLVCARPCEGQLGCGKGCMG